jgi:hypothetical protein
VNSSRGAAPQRQCFPEHDGRSGGIRTDERSALGHQALEPVGVDLLRPGVDGVARRPGQ